MKFTYCELDGAYSNVSCVRYGGALFEADVAPCRYENYPDDNNEVFGSLVVDEFSRQQLLMFAIVLSAIVALLVIPDTLITWCVYGPDQLGVFYRFAAGLVIVLLFALGSLVAGAVMLSRVKSSSDLFCTGTFDPDSASDGIDGGCANQYRCNGADLVKKNEDLEDSARTFGFVMFCVGPVVGFWVISLFVIGLCYCCDSEGNFFWQWAYNPD